MRALCFHGMAGLPWLCSTAAPGGIEGYRGVTPCPLNMIGEQPCNSLSATMHCLAHLCPALGGRHSSCCCSVTAITQQCDSLS